MINSAARGFLMQGNASDVIFTPLSILLFVIDLGLPIWPFWGNIKSLFKKKSSEA